MDLNAILSKINHFLYGVTMDLTALLSKINHFATKIFTKTRDLMYAGIQKSLQALIHEFNTLQKTLSKDKSTKFCQ